MLKNKRDDFKGVRRVLVCAAGVILVGCGGETAVHEPGGEKNKVVMEEQASGEAEDLAEAQIRAGVKRTEGENENAAVPEDEKAMGAEAGSDGDGAEPVVREADWSEYFDGFNGTAVLYEADAGEYVMYNRELAIMRSSPCSTFKIVSSLIALENGVVDADDSVHAWSGEIFWNENWNRDIDFRDAFRASCVWYFRELIDETGKETIQRELDRLQYGNCDISDWEGRLNTNNSNRALTGFWIESSLKISPKEQVDVMERIFGKDSIYSEKSRNELKRVMLVEEARRTTMDKGIKR